MDVADADERDDAGVDLAVGGGLEAVRGLDALGRRVGGAVRAQWFATRAAEYAGDHGAGDRDVQHGAPMGIEEVGEPTQHLAYSSFGSRPRAGARSASHHSTIGAVQADPELERQAGCLLALWSAVLLDRAQLGERALVGFAHRADVADALLGQRCPRRTA